MGWFLSLDPIRQVIFALGVPVYLAFIAWTFWITYNDDGLYD